MSQRNHYSAMIARALVLILLSLVALSPALAATMENNSDTINLDPLVQNGTGGGGEEDEEEEGGTNPQTPTPPDVPPPPSEPGEVVVTVGTPPSEGASDGGSGDTGDTSVTETLTGSGAVSSDPGQSPDDVGIDWSTGGSGGVYISGDKVRSSLGGIGLTRLVIRGWDPVTKKFITVTEGRVPPGGNALARTNDELGLLAASASMEDGRLGQIYIHGTVDLEYRTSGRILWVIPHSFVLKVHVDATQATPETRVQLTYPWYRWLMWLTVPRAELVATLDAAVTESVATTTDSKDAEARLFVGVAAALKRIHGEYERGIRIIL